MSTFNPKKLSVDFQLVTPTIPIMPRIYTLTHSDLTAELFLNIGLKYAYDKINAMRDEVLGEWFKIGPNYFFYVHLYVDGDLGPTVTAIRNAIFIRELPLALQAIRYGDNKFFSAYPELDNVPILVYFNSINPYFNRIENWGTFSDYNLTRFERRCLPDSYNGVDLTNVKCLDSEKKRDTKLEKAFIEAFNLDPVEDKITYYYNRIDLDEDGKPEIFVYLIGPTVCGTGGCSAAIFKQSLNRYELISKFSLVRNPIIITNNKTNGFGDILMFVSGGGIKSFIAELKYTKNGYPSNPSGQPRLKPGTTVSGVAIIANEITNSSGITI
ncbi:Staygreen protein [Clostridium grantii DSM 8605]|uniref:Staygreen protein n=1 Tax=Clostridium grantii DSM 8605 TaxID=1121316 RepID=A0A1M5V5Z4_9CLOT|nr:Staygreen protein [Clostridium grantii DSM 8605]